MLDPLRVGVNPCQRHTERTVQEGFDEPMTPHHAHGERQTASGELQRIDALVRALQEAVALEHAPQLADGGARNTEVAGDEDWFHRGAAAEMVNRLEVIFARAFARAVGLFVNHGWQSLALGTGQPAAARGGSRREIDALWGVS